MKFRFGFLVGSAMAVTIVAPSTVFAHHSYAMFDSSKEQTVKGTVQELDWQNPHVYIDLLVKDDAGNDVHYSIETGSITVLVRAGWKVNTVKVSDSISVTYNPYKNGKPGGKMDTATVADGSVLKGY